MFLIKYLRLYLQSLKLYFNAKFQEAPPANTTAYCLTISDKVFDLVGDGSKMRTYIT